MTTRTRTLVVGLLGAVVGAACALGWAVVVRESDPYRGQSPPEAPLAGDDEMRRVIERISSVWEEEEPKLDWWSALPSHGWTDEEIGFLRLFVSHAEDLRGEQRHPSVDAADWQREDFYLSEERRHEQWEEEVSILKNTVELLREGRHEEARLRFRGGRRR